MTAKPPQPTGAMRALLLDSWNDGKRIFLTLFRLAFPLLIAVRLLDEAFGIVTIAGEWLAPAMGAVGLPGEAGVVLAMAMLLQIYAALLLFLSLAAQLDLSVAQITVLMSMILVAHSLPVESRIVGQAGMRMAAAILLRIAGAFTLGALLNFAYGDTYLQEAVITPLPPAEELTLGGWLLTELRNWVVVFVIILLLTTFINLLKYSHIEERIVTCIAPFFRPLGIGEKAMTMVMTGMLLGLSYGGGLLIQEYRRGAISRRDALCASALLCLCHSIIEDTLLMLAVGAHWSGVLLGRLLLTLAFMPVFALLAHRLSDSALNFLAPPRRAADA